MNVVMWKAHYYKMMEAHWLYTVDSPTTFALVHASNVVKETYTDFCKEKKGLKQTYSQGSYGNTGTGAAASFICCSASCVTITKTYRLSFLCTSTTWICARNTRIHTRTKTHTHRSTARQEAPPTSPVPVSHSVCVYVCVWALVSTPGLLLQAIGRRQIERHRKKKLYKDVEIGGTEALLLERKKYTEDYRERKKQR